MWKISTVLFLDNFNFTWKHVSASSASPYYIDRSLVVPTIVKKISSFSFPLQNTAWQDNPLPYLNAFSLESAWAEESGKSMNTVHDFRQE